MENKQSSIEWLFHKLWNESKDKMVWYALLKISKQMHKQEIERAYYDGGVGIRDKNYKGMEEYYNETYERKTTESK